MERAGIAEVARSSDSGPSKALLSSWSMRISYADIARFVEPGEWTSYGDIAQAVHGSPRAARAVGRTTATSDDFPNAHRVLRADGSIADGSGPCADRARPVKTRLAEEGVAFDGRGRADPAKRVAWDELARRAGLKPRGTHH